MILDERRLRVWRRVPFVSRATRAARRLIVRAAREH